MNRIVCETLTGALLAAVALPQAAPAAESDALTAAKAREWKPIPMRSFSDSINHALMSFPQLL